MSFIRRLTFVALTLCAATAWGQLNTREPQIGYLYPGGGQRGTVVQITAGGQYLTGTTDVYVSGKGVRASVIRYIRPLRNLQKEQRQLLQKRLKEVRDMRLAELSGKGRGRSMPAQKAPGKKGKGSCYAKEVLLCVCSKMTTLSRCFETSDQETKDPSLRIA